LLKPMLLSEAPYPFTKDDWLFEYKWDGFRCLVVFDGKVTLLSRRGNDLTAYFPGLLEIKAFLPKDSILDGEVIWGEGKKGSFYNLLGFSKKVANVQLVVFDVLKWKGSFLCNQPLWERKKYLPDLNFPFIKAPYVLTEGEQFFQKAQSENYEGIVAKKLSSFYYPGKRTKEWLKIKNLTREKFLLTEAFLKNEQIHALTVYDPSENKSYQLPFSAGSDFLAMLKPIIKDKTPNRLFFYPLLLVEVQYLEKTATGIRHPKVVGFFPV